MRKLKMPSTSAGLPSSASVERDPVEADSVVQPLDLASLLEVLATGAFTVLFAALFTGASLSIPLTTLPSLGDVVGAVVFGSISAAGLCLFVSRWWQAMKRMAQRPQAWSAVTVPFFVVVGAALGWAVMSDIFPSAERGIADRSRDRGACTEALGFEGGDDWNACLTIARECQMAAIANGRLRGDFHACVRRGLMK